MGVIEENLDQDTAVRVFIMADERKVELDLKDIEMIFKGYRPRLISREDFRFINKIIKQEVKEYLKGKLVHTSKVSDELWQSYYVKGMTKTIRQKGNTYIKKGK